MVKLRGGDARISPPAATRLQHPPPPAATRLQRPPPPPFAGQRFTRPLFFRRAFLMPCVFASSAFQIVLDLACDWVRLLLICRGLESAA